MTRFDRKQNFRARRIRTAVLLLVCAAALGGIAYAWLSHERAVAAIAEIDAPMSLWIRSGANEDAVYLDFTGIDKTVGEYKDFVFAVAGEYVNNFKIQLAYTTNNQFEYELYEAATLNAKADGCVTYKDQGYDEDDPNKDEHIHYYIIASVDPLPMKTLNPSDNAKRADKNHTLSQETYYLTEKGPDSYYYVERDAYPLYRQTIDSIGVTPPFTKYFILRVIWGDDHINNRETDMIYIAAKAGA